VVSAAVGFVVFMALSPRRLIAASAATAAMLLIQLRPSFLMVAATADLALFGFLAVSWRNDRRDRKERADLPEVSDAIAAALAGGSSVADALDAARTHAGDRLAASMLSMASALRLGVPPRDVMSGLDTDWADHDHETRLVLAAIEVGAVHPSQRGRALTDAADSLRLRRLRREDLTAQAAQARASALVVTWSPWAVLLVASGLDGAHLERLISTDLGRWFLVGAAGLSLVGSATMRVMIARSGLS